MRKKKLRRTADDCGGENDVNLVDCMAGWAHLKILEALMGGL